MPNFHIETLAVHAGQNPHGDPTTYARAVAPAFSAETGITPS